MKTVILCFQVYPFIIMFEIEVNEVYIKKA